MTSPTKIARRKTVVLKFCIDPVTAKILGERMKADLYVNMNFKKAKLEDARLVCIDRTYDPYRVVAGKYSIEYCKKSAFTIDVEKKLNGDNTATNLNPVKHFQHSDNGYFILDCNGEEIDPSLLPYVPPQKENVDKYVKNKKNLSSIKISSKQEIEFLRSKLVKRPSDVGEIVNEIFEVSERTTVFCPIYQFTFKDEITEKEVFVKIDGITGKTIKDELDRILIDNGTINSIEYPSEVLTQIEPEPLESKSEHKDLDFIKNALADKDKPLVKPNTLESILKLLPKSVEVFNVGDNVTAVVGDLNIPDEATLRKTLVVKGQLTVGSGCQLVGRLKGLGDIVIGANTKVDGNVVSGGKVVVGSCSCIGGSVESVGSIELQKRVVIEGSLFSQSSVSLSEFTMVLGSITATKVICVEKGKTDE